MAEYMFGFGCVKKLEKASERVSEKNKSIRHTTKETIRKGERGCDWVRERERERVEE